MMDKFVEWYVHGKEARARVAALEAKGWAVEIVWWPDRLQWMVRYWEEQR